MVDSKPFAPKSADELKTEILTETGIVYEGNEAIVDKLVEKGLKDEKFKENLHSQKKGLQEKEAARIERMKAAGIDPETGEKLGATNVPKSPEMSWKDIKSLQDVDDADAEELMDFAKYKNISIAEAKKHPAMVSLIKTRVEERKSADVANTTKNSTRKNGGDTILEDFNKGKVSEADDDVNALVEAQIAQRKARAKIGN